MDLNHIAENYRSLLEQVERFRGIPLSRFLQSEAIPENSGIYGIVFNVTSSRISCRNSATKTIQLLDPTTSNRTITFIIQDCSSSIAIGDIILATNITPCPKKSGYLIDQPSVTIFTSFSLDYNRVFRNKATLNEFYSDIDLQIFFLLETYTAIKILHPLSITQATQDFQSEKQIYRRRPNGNPYGYIDMLGLIVKRKFLNRSITLTLWDGSPCDMSSVLPSNDGSAPGRPLAVGPPNEVYDRVNQQFSRVYCDLLKDQFVNVNIWNNNKPQPDSQQYVAAGNLSMDQFNIGILMNVEKEVIRPKDPQSGKKEVAFTLRSGQQYGKALRVAQPCSVIGRIFFRMLKERVSDIIFHLDKIDPSYGPFDHELPCIRLEDGPSGVAFRLQSDFSLLTRCHQSNQQEERNDEQSEEEETGEEEANQSHTTSNHLRGDKSPSPGPSNPPKRIRISRKSSGGSDVQHLNTQVDHVTLFTSLPKRITVPFVHSPYLQVWVESNFPSFLSFASLVSTSIIRLSTTRQLFKGLKMNHIDQQTYNTSAKPLEQIFDLARAFRLILDYDPPDSAQID